MGLKNRIDPQKPSIRITENIWHKLPENSRKIYAEQIKKALALGSLLVLGGAERHEVNVYPYLEDSFSPAGDVFKKMSLYNRLYPSGGFDPNDPALILRANTVFDKTYSLGSTEFKNLQTPHVLART